MLNPEERDTRSERTGRSRTRQERLAQMIHSYRQALQAPEEQETHEAILSLLEGVAAGEITPAHCVRLLRYQAVRCADVPLAARLYRQAASDLQLLQREGH
jgi:hypothetical protein